MPPKRRRGKKGGNGNAGGNGDENRGGNGGGNDSGSSSPGAASSSGTNTSENNLQDVPLSPLRDASNSGTNTSETKPESDSDDEFPVRTAPSQPTPQRIPPLSVTTTRPDSDSDDEFPMRTSTPSRAASGLRPPLAGPGSSTQTTPQLPQFSPPTGHHDQYSSEGSSPPSQGSSEHSGQSGPHHPPEVQPPSPRPDDELRTTGASKDYTPEDAEKIETDEQRQANQAPYARQNYYAPGGLAEQVGVFSDGPPPEAAETIPLVS